MSNEQNKAKEIGEDSAFMQMAYDGGVWEPGLTKREYFSAKAMQGLLSTLDLSSDFCQNKPNIEYLAELSVFAADSLLIELSIEVTTQTNEL